MVKRNGEQDLLNILGSMFIFLQFLGTYNCTSVLSIVATERNIVYRERFAGMYSAWIYSLSQVNNNIEAYVNYYIIINHIFYNVY